MGRPDGVLPVRIALLGTPLVTSADAAVVYPLPRKTLDVLAYLLLNRGRTMPRASVAFALFPDDEEELARGSLRRNLSYLLSALPEAPAKTPFVMTEGKTIAWGAKAPAVLDIDEFELAISEHREDDAVALYAGELLPTLYADWTTADRERLRGEFHDVLQRKTEAERSRRRFDDATALARTLLHEDPWREDIVRLLIAIRHEAGDRSGALAEYERFASRLQAELHTEPMPETVAVRDAVMRGALLATSERSAAPRSPPAATPQPGLPFVGRDQPMETALERWHIAAEGCGGLLFVGGEVGIGKSRFVTELARVIEREGGSVLRGQTSVVAERVPYEAFLDALQPNASPAAVEELLGEHASASLTDDRSARARFFEAIRCKMADLANRRPLAVILEDLHWAGPDTIALLDFVALRLNAIPLFIVVTMRTDELQRGHRLRILSHQLEGNDIAQIITLRRLNEAEARSAMEASLSRQEASSEISRAVTWADGVPLLITEALRDIVAGRPAAHADIGALLGDRFDRLTPAAATALVFAATIGVTFELGILAAALGWNNAAVIDALANAVELGLVRVAASRSGIAFAFTHHVLHAASYERIESNDRARAHAMIGRTLAALPASEGSRAGEIARHFQSAGEADRAAGYWLSAARYALSLFANHDAHSAASAGLALAGENASLRYDLLRIREDATRRIGDLSERRADSLALLECAGDDTERRCEALERVFESHRDEPGTRRDAREQLARLAGTCDPCAAAYERVACTDAYLRTDYAQARDIALGASQRLERLGDARAALVARLRHIAMLGMLNDFFATEAAVAKVRGFFEQTDDLPLAAEFYRVASSALGDERLEDALADARRSLELALRVGDRYAEARARQNIESVLGRLGRFAEASGHMTATIEAYRDVGDTEGLCASVLNLSACQTLYGDFEGALRTLQTLGSGDLAAIHVIPALVRGYIEMRRGHLEKAVAELSSARQKASVLNMPLRVAQADASLAETLWLAGNAVESRRVLDAVLLQFAALEQPGASAELRALSARLHAEQGDLDASLADARASRTLMERYPIQDRSQAVWHLAVAYAYAGDDEAASRFAAESARAFVEDALQLSADAAEFYSALPWHQEVIAFLSGRGFPKKP
jgi:DNA-binding SARP family transcriptional activator